MGKFTNNIDPSGSAQITGITTFDDLDVAKITNLSASTIDISEGINSEGLIKANEAEFETAILGDLKIQNNIITLNEESILEEIILNANKITLSSDGSDVNLAKVTTTELEIKDTLITLSSDNTGTNVDRGLLINYPVSVLTDSSGFRSGFIGLNSDNIFRMITGISTISDNNFYDNTPSFTLGTLEIGTLLINNLSNNSTSNDLTISTSGNLNLLSTNNDNSVILGNGLDSKTIINSNLEIKGTLEAETFAFFNSNVSTYAKKNLLLFLDNSVKIDNISEDNGIYTLTLNEDRVFAVGGYIYFEGIDISNSINQTYLDKFNGIHSILSVSTDYLSITIELESGLDIPSFSDDVYALIGSLNSESLTNNSGLSVLSYEDSSKVLREHKINYEYNSDNYLDSSWLFNRNLKTENTLLLKNNKIIYDNDNEYSRIYVKDDGELYFKNNNNYEYKLTNEDNDDIFNLNNWAITNDEILHTFNNVSIGTSTMSSFYKLSVKGNVEITGQLDALSGNLVANNIDASGSLSVNGFKSTNINTQNLTIEDSSFQLGFLDVSLIDSVDENNNEIKSRIDHKLQTDIFVYFQNTNVYFSNGDSIDGFRKINVISETSIQIYEDDGTTISDINYKTINLVKYIGLKNLVGSDVIDNSNTEFSGSEPIKVRIYMLSNVTFKYSYDGGFTFQNYASNISLNTNIILDDGVIISFLDNTNLENGDYFEFDCCPQYVESKDENGVTVEPDENNFLGEFGKIFPSNELLDSGFEIMIRNPNSYTLESQKFSYYYLSSNDKFWRLTDTLNIVGSLNLKVDTSSINFGEDEEITLTHVHNTGLLLNQDKQLLYGSSNEYIYGDGSNLFINSSNNLNITSIETIFSGNLRILDSITQATTITASGQISGGTITDGFASLNNGALTNITTLDGSGDLTMGTITMTGFSVDADGDVVSKSIDNTNGGIINTGSITQATTITASGQISGGTITDGFASLNNGALTNITTLDGSGDLTMGTITMTGFSVDADGDVVSKSIDNTDGGIINTGSITQATTITASGQISGGTITDGFASLNNGALTNITTLDGSGDLTMGTITMTGFSVDADGDVVSKSLDNTNGGITNTGSITEATTITASGQISGGTITDGVASLSNGALTDITTLDGSGDLTMGTITMTGFSVDADGYVVSKSIDNTNGGIINTGSITQATTITASGQISGGTITDGFASLNNGALSDITTLDGSGDLTMGTITMTGFSVDADGDVVSKSLDNTNGGIINTGSITQATTITASGQISGGTITDGVASLNNGALSDITTLDGSGDLTMGTITMTGFSVDADGDVVSKSLDNTNGGIINTGSITQATTITASGQISGGTITDGVASLSNGALSDITTLDGSGDLTMGTITMTGFSVDADGDVVSKSLDNTNGGIINTGSITEATTITASGQISGGTITDGVASLSNGALSDITTLDGSGDLTMGTITMTGFSVDADGDVVSKSLNNTNGGITNTGSITEATTITASGQISGGTITDSVASLSNGALSDITTLDGSGDLTMGTITMTGFSVDADGDVVSKSLDNTNGGIINTGSITEATTITASGQISGGTITDGVASLSNGALSDITTLDGSGDLTMGTITMTGFSVDADGDVVSKSLDNTNGGITNTGSITEVTTITASGQISGGTITDGVASLSNGALSDITTLDGSGDLTMGTITMTGFSVDADGDVVSKSLDNTNGGIINTGSITEATTITASGQISGGTITDGIASLSNGALSDITTLDGSGDLTMGTITMTGFSVDADGDVVSKSLDNTNGGIINTGSITEATTITASGQISGGTITDGNASLSSGVLSGLSSINGNIVIGDVSSQLGFFGATVASKTVVDNLDSLGSSVLDTSLTPTNDNLNDLREDIELIHNKLDNLIDALQSLGLI